MGGVLVDDHHAFGSLRHDVIAVQLCLGGAEGVGLFVGLRPLIGGFDAGLWGFGETGGFGSLPCGGAGEAGL